MKKLGGPTLFIAGFLTLLGVLVSPSSVSAAACANVSSFGSVALSVPGLPNVEEKLLWVRMQTPDPAAKVFVEINSDDCLDVGGYESTPNQWSWQTNRVGGTPVPVQFESIDHNSIKLIGVSEGVKVDRILLTEKDCVPQDFGTNCQGALELKQTTDNDVVVLPSPVAGAAQGKVILSSTPENNRSTLRELIYMVNSKVIQRFQDPQPFDTTLLENGKHTVYIETRLDTGATVREVVTIDTKNPENFLSPLMRWMRLNAALIIRVLLVVAAIFLLAVIIFGVKYIRRTRRERTFHGF